MTAKNLMVNGSMYLYGAVGESWGDYFTASDVAMALADHGPGDITVRINSGGGIAFEGMAIYSLLKAHRGKVTMAVDGIAASAASLLLMASDTREMRDGAMIMIHDPSGFTHGPASEHKEAATRLDKLAANYAEVYAAASGKTAKAVRELMLATTFMTADEAIEAGFATAKITEAATEFAAFDYKIYANAPKCLEPFTRGEKPPATMAGNIIKKPITEAARMRMRMSALT